VVAAKFIIGIVLLVMSICCYIAAGISISNSKDLDGFFLRVIFGSLIGAVSLIIMWGAYNG